jgi:hypothetical protein
MKRAKISRSSPFSLAPLSQVKPWSDNGWLFNRHTACAAHHEFWSSSSDLVDRVTRSMAMRAGATCAVRVTAFDSAPALPEFERTGALMAKNAAETIRNVWMFLVFMRTPFLTALLS